MQNGRFLFVLYSRKEIGSTHDHGQQKDLLDNLPTYGTKPISEGKMSQPIGNVNKYSNHSANSLSDNPPEQAPTRVTRKGTGKVHFDGSKAAMTPRQRASYNAIEKLAGAIGTDVYIYQSYVKDGKRVYKDHSGKEQEAPNGWYDPADGSIHIDLYAGQNGESLMLFTVAHELTHFIRQWSPAKFKVLADFLMEQYGKKGVSVNALVQAQIAKAKRQGRTISYDTAYEEVVADSMETMLKDGSVLEKLAELKARDNTLWEKLKAYIHKLAAKLRAIYKDLEPQSLEGQLVARMTDAMDRLQALFTESLAEAGENYRASGTAFSSKGQPAYSLRDKTIPTREALVRKAPMKIVDISKPKTKGSFAERRKQILANAEDIIKKPYRNTDTDTMIFLTRDSYTHMFSNPGEIQLNAAEHLPEFIENAVLTHVEPPNHGSDYTDGVYTFFAAARGKAIIPIKLKVKEYRYSNQKLPKNIEEYFNGLPQGYASSYDTVVLELEEIEESPNGSAGSMNKKFTQSGPSELSVIRIADLLNLVKGNARKYIPSSAAQKNSAPEGDVKYSVSTASYVYNIGNFVEQVDNIDKLPSGEALVVCRTPSVFTDIGLNDLPMTLNLEHAKDAITLNPNHKDRYIGKAALKDLPRALENPVAIIASGSHPDTSLVAIVDLKGQNGKSVITPVFLNGESKAHGIRMDVNAIASAHERRNAIKGLLMDALDTETNGNIGIFYMNNKKATQLIRGEGLQLPNSFMSMNGFVHSITENGSPVKALFKNMAQTETKQFKRWFGKSKAVNADGTPKVYYHGTPNGDFTVFHGWQYFTDSREYADIYQNQGASSNGYKQTATNPKTYAVYLAPQKVFDTRTAKARRIFEEEFYGKWGNGAPLSEKGLPDWTDGDDLIAFFEEKGYDYDGIFLDEGAVGGYGEEVKSRGISMVVRDSTAVKSAADNIGTFDRNNPDIRYSDRDYSYEALISKPDMVVTTISGTVPNNRADVVAQAKKNAAKIGRINPKDGSVSIRIDDNGADVVVGTDGLKHGLRRTKDPQTDVNYIVTLNAGEILKHSIQVNEAIPKKESASESYVLFGVAQNTKGELYIVRSVVNRFNQTLESIDALYALNAKKELAATKSPRFAAKPLSVTSSTISIAELLDLVNQYFPQNLPEDVLKHFGYAARPEGDMAEDMLYSDRDTESLTNRALLAEALESAAQSDLERQQLSQYKDKIDFLNEQEAKLHQLNGEIKELSFAKGPRDKARIAQLQGEARKTANRISLADKQLLRLEASKPLQAVLAREKKAAALQESGIQDGSGPLYSRRDYWKPKLNRAQWELLNRELDRQVELKQNFLDPYTKWLYAREKGVEVFAIYGIGDGTEPTPLYATGGTKAAADDKYLQLYLKGENDESTGQRIDRGAAAFNRRINALLAQQQREQSADLDAAPGRTSTAGNAGVHVSQPKRNGRGDPGAGTGNRVTGVKLSDRDTDSLTNRALLAEALESAAQSDLERQQLSQYKDKIDFLNEQEAKLHQLNGEIKELSFAKGPRDRARIAQLQNEARKTANRISLADKQLLRLEASKPLQAVLEREKKAAFKRAEQRGKEALEAYREKAELEQEAIIQRYRESRKKGIESRSKTALRHKIKDVVHELNQYLLKGTKDRHVPEALQKAVAMALDAVNMDTVGAEARIAKLRQLHFFAVLCYTDSIRK